MAKSDERADRQVDAENERSPATPDSAGRWERPRSRPVLPFRTMPFPPSGGTSRTHSMVERTHRLSPFPASCVLP